jgi:thiol-disulfide isomerase/thioredoxin
MRRCLALFLMVAAAAACTSSPEPVSTPTLPSTPTELPAFTADEFQALLRSLRGTPVVVNFWGSWCAPCREEGPRLARAARAYDGRVQFLGVDVKDTKDAARTFIGEMGWTYPSVFDPSSNADIERDIGYFAQPVTLFYDRDGKIANQISGPAETAPLEAGIERILR